MANRRPAMLRGLLLVLLIGYIMGGAVAKRQLLRDPQELLSDEEIQLLLAEEAREGQILSDEDLPPAPPFSEEEVW